jgi:hypothetical protein
MKVINVVYVFAALFLPSFSAVAVQPSTFGGFVNSFGRLTNTIKVNILTSTCAHDKRNVANFPHDKSLRANYRLQMNIMITLVR